jgi:hypothetical protein
LCSLEKDGIQIDSAKNINFAKNDSLYRNCPQKAYNTLKDLQQFTYKIYVRENKNICESRTVFEEIGVANVEKIKSKLFLRRDYVFQSRLLNNNNELSLIRNPGESPYEFALEKNQYILLCSPHSSEIQNFNTPNSIVSSNDDGYSFHVCLEENTLLGRMNGIVQSIDKYELREMLDDQITASLIDYKDPLPLATKSLALSKSAEIRCGNLVMIATGRPKKPLAGTLIFNLSSKKLELFDGIEWRRLATEE